MGRCENGGLHDTRQRGVGQRQPRVYERCDCVALENNPRLAQSAATEVTKGQGECVSVAQRAKGPTHEGKSPVPHSEFAAHAESGTDELGHGQTPQTWRRVSSK